MAFAEICNVCSARDAAEKGSSEVTYARNASLTRERVTNSELLKLENWFRKISIGKNNGIANNTNSTEALPLVPFNLFSSLCHLTERVTTDALLGLLVHGST